jgi:tRNA threonylcarbamoyladenosine biosynthesis protein TsaE
LLIRKIESIDETIEFSKKLARILQRGDILCLTGDLGAGKTTFTKYLCGFLGVEELVNSPTFSIVNEYEGRLKVNHFDVYRLGDADELEDIGFDEYIFSDAVSVIEWADLIRSVLPIEAIWLDITFDEDGSRIYKLSCESGETMERIKGGII